MIILRSAFPVRISYNVKVRSEPILASTEDSLRLNLTAVIVSVDVGKVRFVTGALLGYLSDLTGNIRQREHVLGFVPYLHET